MSGSIRDRELRAAAAVASLNKSNTFDDWMAIGEGLRAGQEAAMAAAGVTKPYGASYNREHNAWLARNKWAQDKRLAHPTNSNAIWMADNKTAVEAWRATLTPEERDAFNHPGTVRREFRKAQGGSASGGGRRGAAASSATPGASGRPSQAMVDALRAALDQALTALTAKDQEIADLKARLAGGGSAPGHLPSLGLKPSYNRARLDARFRLLIRLAHPDNHGTGDTEWAQTINADYEKGKAWLENQQADQSDLVVP